MLLDTHIWFWHAIGDARRVGPRVRRAIDRAATRGTVVVSTVSMFEIAALVASGRIRLAISAETWIRQTIDTGGLQVAEVTSSIALEAGSIPAAALADPMDRLLVATARTLDIPIVTRDARILDYVRTSRIGNAIDASR